MERNELYPVFLKVNALNTLIVGGGNVALEKLTFMLKSSPNAQITMVAPIFRPDIIALSEKHGIRIIEDVYDAKYLIGNHVVIATTDDIDVNVQVYYDCKERSILVNVADNPPYCDFYMGGIVTKGNVKIAISTNGQSPTTAKRLRQFFEDVIPDDVDQLVQNLNRYRDTLKGNFEEKVKQLNEVTKSLVSRKKIKTQL
ncbi:precorrin-2 dehydrogenase / sirohydrochlorin ferrochelatase [Zhouia amylolytica]|uniref:precorrin-2 dehydrogenase n=2 Tax=Zhouia amylolytica TaxID=376730 RepID=W2UNW4_9FLAO|nr:bifunctional precorrin-2 dehydrogenase/sirohydrochlorin ferrochelatase [Zhouia amylolytica]ETN95032.1 siroheme synthase, N-terminal domain protein [Zhouia amylolytica AD3]MCQ0110619.1 bifunctional precorrin-2 dehydrogenase/sirohydrochlorin ferrochelatase [Zhouia amylolytica]SFS63813.1 precorrin-2 dehydrogenase / sirohydrochlorin ferrochelatase [Zhouia amylolytica]